VGGDGFILGDAAGAAPGDVAPTTASSGAAVASRVTSSALVRLAVPTPSAAGSLTIASGTLTGVANGPAADVGRLDIDVARPGAS